MYDVVVISIKINAGWPTSYPYVFLHQCHQSPIQNNHHNDHGQLEGWAADFNIPISAWLLGFLTATMPVEPIVAIIKVVITVFIMAVVVTSFMITILIIMQSTAKLIREGDEKAA